MLIKKYGNRRLYDTESSRYITLEDLTAAIRDGAEVKVVDAKSGTDLTQSTLTQIIIEGRGADTILPAPLLHQLIRLGDDALAEFLGRYVQSALELYLTTRKASTSFLPFNPLVAMQQFAQGGTPYAGWGQSSAAPIPVPTTGGPAPTPSTDVEDLRRELDELKGMLRKRKK